MPTFEIMSCKGKTLFVGSLGEATARAMEIDAELQPSFGTSLTDAETGEHVASVIEGVVLFPDASDEVADETP